MSEKRATHVEQRHGAQRRLPVLGAFSIPTDWEMKDGVPKTRGDCPTVRPCPYLACTKHKWLVLQQDRPGNPASGAQGETTIRPIGESCSLDVADRGPHTLEEVGDELDVSATRINQIEQSALRKFKRRLRERLGEDLTDAEVLEALMAASAA